MTDQTFPYVSDIDLRFPTPKQAADVKRVLEVDPELGDRVVKTFHVVQDDECVLRVRFQAVQAKLLRVCVSSFYDYLTVALKCYQEFDDCLR